MDPAICAMMPGVRVAGTALTVQVPGAEGSVLPFALAHARKGDVLVVDRCGDRQHACLGGLVAYAAMKIGIAAIIIDGFATDIDELREHGVPVWARGLSANTGKPMGLSGTVGTPVSCGGVTVRTGDAILADQNGILVLDPDDIEEVAGRAAAMPAMEARMRARIDAGASLYDILQEMAANTAAAAR
jgi:regulator of RNase E activity RraA